MEYLKHGDLQRHIKGPMPEHDVRKVISQVLEGLQYMHANGFIHRDLKPGNIMVVSANPDWFVKITDFRISKRRQQDVTTLHTLQRGTLAFAAPEQLGIGPDGNSGQYTNAVDMWSLGAVAYLLLTNALPFQILSTVVEYVSGRLEFPMTRFRDNNTSRYGQQFIGSVMASKAKDRFSASAAMEHMWLKVPVEVSTDSMTS